MGHACNTFDQAFFERLGRFLGRYDLFGDEPDYLSFSCQVWLAMDLYSKSDATKNDDAPSGDDQRKKVALKIVTEKEYIEREEHTQFNCACTTHELTRC